MQALSWTAHKNLAKSYNQYLLYRLGYGARGEAVERGKDVHTQVEALFKGYDHTLEPHISEALLAHPLTKPEIVGVEVELEHRDVPIHGRSDLVVSTPYGLRIIDWKTGRPYPEHIQQLHWYASSYASWGFPVSSVACVYLDRDTAQPTNQKEWPYDTALAAELEAAAEDEVAFLRSARLPDNLIIPVHGTAADEETQKLIASIDLEGFIADVVEVEVETEDRGIVVGKALRIADAHIGWIPDVLKGRIHARTVRVFAQFQKTEKRHAGLRIAVPTDLIDWHGIDIQPATRTTSRVVESSPVAR